MLNKCIVRKSTAVSVVVTNFYSKSSAINPKPFFAFIGFLPMILIVVSVCT
jgi:hypothetical protein